jgi:hypothetical protein
LVALPDDFVVLVEAWSTAALDELRPDEVFTGALLLELPKEEEEDELDLVLLVSTMVFLVSAERSCVCDLLVVPFSSSSFVVESPILAFRSLSSSVTIRLTIDRILVPLIIDRL